jgi:D-sedoheptulose 7-phosphate isomerase
MQAYLSSLTDALARVSLADLARVAKELESAYAAGRTIYICGNGGSAATASHLAVDLAKSTRAPGARPIRVVSLVDHVAALTAWANDVGYDSVFSGQLAGLAQAGDVVIGISASGNSPNVLAALQYARDIGVTTLGLLGEGGGLARRLCDVWVEAPAPSIEEQEDIHMMLAHLLTRSMRTVVHGQLPALAGQVQGADG